MAGNTFGQLFRVTTAGVSHGPGYLVIIDGCPPGLPLDVADLLPDLQHRAVRLIPVTKAVTAEGVHAMDFPAVQRAVAAQGGQPSDLAELLDRAE